MRMRRLSGFDEHLNRRRSSVMMSSDGTSSNEVLAIFLLVDDEQLLKNNGFYTKGGRCTHQTPLNKIKIKKGDGRKVVDDAK